MSVSPKGVGFDPLFQEAGSNAFTLSPSKWIEQTNAIGIVCARDYASINELICLSNMENLNAVFINDGISQTERLIKLNQIAIQQMKVLEESESRRYLK